MELQDDPFSGMDRRDALALARRFGCNVSFVSSSGEVLVSHPSILGNDLLHLAGLK
jgi:hypothetical protein